jgi:capsular polysaccharide biosynthesis protein
VTIALRPTALSHYRLDATGDVATLGSGGSRTVLLDDESDVDHHIVCCFLVDHRVKDFRHEVSLRNPAAQRFISPATYVARLDRGVVLGSSFAVATADDRYVLDSLRTRSMLPRLGYPMDDRMGIELTEPVTDSATSAAVLGAQTSVNYFHWLFESLTRVDLLQRADLAHQPLLVPEPTAMHLETLDAAGISPDQLVVVGAAPRRFATLYLPSRGLGNIHSFTRSGTAFLRAMGIAQALRKAPGKPRRRIYISRARARTRHIANERSLMSLLAENGFECLVTEEMSALEQMAMFSECDVIAGAHGAGLANAVFAASGAVVLEFSPEGQDFSGANLYRGLAATCGHTYGCVVCPITDSDSRGMTIDLGMAEAALQSAVAASRRP